MPVTVQDISDLVTEWSPEGYAYPWDRVGLRIGEPGARVTGVLVVLSVTPAAVAAAKRAGANLILAHHPPLWEPLKTLRTDDPDTRLWLDMAQAGIACYAAHTNLDVTPGGVNAVLADQIGVVETEILFPAPHAEHAKLIVFVPESHLAAVRDAVCSTGAGVIGDYTHCSFSTPGTGTFLPGESSNPFSGRKGKVSEEPEQRLEVIVPKARTAPVLRALLTAHPYEEVAYDLVPLANRDASVGLGLRGRLPEPMGLDDFARQVRDRLGVSHVRIAGAPVKRVQSVALLGGSGGGEISRVPHEVDVYVTGDVKYHDAFIAADRGFAVIDAGHHGTEAPMIPVWAKWLRSRLRGRGVRVAAYAEPETFRAITA